MLLLTGATGYLGSGIARELIARREPFRILVRDPKRLEFDPEAHHVEVAVGDLRDSEVLRAAVRNVDSVIHTAALVKTWARDRRDFWRINVECLQNLLEAADEAGVGKIIYTSSFLALGPSWNASACELMSHGGPFHDAYEESKARALDWLRAEGLSRYPMIVMFPGVLYGPGPKTEGNLVGGMIDQYIAGKFPGILGSGHQRWSFTFIVEVVKAHLAALEKGRPGEEYLLGGDNRSLNDFFRVLASCTRIRRPIRHIPFRVGKAIGHLELARARLYGHVPELTPGIVEIFKHSWVYSSAKAVRDLDYFIAPLEEGLMKTIEAQNPRLPPH